MTKKEIKLGLKNNGVKGWSRAIICSVTGGVIVGDYTGKIDENNTLFLEPIDMSDTTSKRYLIQF